MINLTILRGTWQHRRGEISRLCDAIDTAEPAQRPVIEKEMFRIMDECEHLRVMLANYQPQKP